jgi:hypothetical protein
MDLPGLPVSRIDCRCRETIAEAGSSVKRLFGGERLSSLRRFPAAFAVTDFESPFVAVRL